MNRAHIRVWSALLLLAWVSGCAVVPFRREPPRPGRTTFDSPLVILPAQNLGNFLIIEAKWDRNGPYRFVVDTGSSVTLMSPALVRRYPGRQLAAQPRRVRVAGVDGVTTELPASSLRRLEFGDAVFEDVPVLEYDCASLSAHLGQRIDGVLGFPLFREALLTLDYLGARVILQPARTGMLLAGTTLAFDDARKIPLIPLQIGERSLLALIDSGSDAAFTLNPVGLEPAWATPPRVGATIGTLTGDRTQTIGRLAGTIAIGDQVFRQPIVDLTDELATIGAEVLRHFAITFDQERNRVIFHRDARTPIEMPARRSAGVSFNKTPAYWRVVGVVPDSPAERVGVERGDLVTRINGEPVSKWDLRRYEQLVATAAEISLTFLFGNNETEKRVSVFELVP